MPAATGPRTIVATRTEGASSRATATGCWRARVRGPTPVAMKMSTAIAIAQTSRTFHQPSSQVAKASAAHTPAVASDADRMKTMTFWAGGPMSRTLSRAVPPRRPSAACRAASARLVRSRAVSPAAHSAAVRSRSPATASSSPAGAATISRAGAGRGR